jgi:ribosomal protein L33
LNRRCWRFKRREGEREKARTCPSPSLPLNVVLAMARSSKRSRYAPIRSHHSLTSSKFANNLRCPSFVLVAIHRTIIVKLVSTALTGIFYPASKPRTAPKLAMMKYDKIGTRQRSSPLSRDSSTFELATDGVLHPCLFLMVQSTDTSSSQRSKSARNRTINHHYQPTSLYRNHLTQPNDPFPLLSSSFFSIMSFQILRVSDLVSC